MKNQNEYDRIEAVVTDGLTDAQARSMVNYLLGALAVVVEQGPTPSKIADACERARHLGSLAR